MLRGLRKASSNWIGKAVMAAVVGFLVISFGIWGIGDIFRNGFGQSTVARVGPAELGIDEFKNLYNDRLQQYSRQFGRTITPGVARAMGIEQQVLGQAISELALDQRARQLRLGIPTDDVVKEITSNPAFKGSNGQFDEALFVDRLRQRGYSEQRFISEMRRGTLRQQITAALGDGPPPRTIAAILDQYRNEERTIEYVQFDKSKLGDIPDPTPEELSSYFDEHRFAFRAPEFRELELITVSQSDLAGTIEIGEADLKRAYEDRIRQYSTPERRRVLQISFANADAAAKASERLKGGLTFDDLAKEPETAPRLVDLGNVLKSDIIDPAVAKAAFGLADGAVSDPVTGRFGTVILRVTAIEAATTKSFEAVEADLRRDLAASRAKSEVEGIRDKIEEELGGGASFEDIAKKLDLKRRTIAAVDRSGRGPDGKEVPDLPSPDVVSSAFNADVGAANDALTLPAGGYVWYNVVNITPSRERSLDEVKDEVKVHYLGDETIKRLDAKTADLVTRLKSGTPFADLAAAEGLKIETAWGLKRQGGVQMPPRVTAEVFRLGKDGIGSAEGAAPTDRFVFRVTDIKLPTFDPNSADAAQVLEQLKQPFNGDLLSQYVVRLESDLGTDINQTALAQATGRASGSGDDGGGGF